MAIEKLPFQVISATSWQDGHHPSSLHIQNHQPTTYGWHSQQFCTFPQVLVLRLTPGKSRLRKVQLLAHHYMISKRIDLFVGDMEQPKQSAMGSTTEDPAASELLAGEPKDLLKNIQFQRLGYVALDDNERTQYKARELKSIHVDVFGEFVKLVFEKCHINSLNLYNQVGLIAINILGEIPDEFMFQSLVNQTTEGMLVQPTPVSGSVTEDLSYEMFHDPLTTKWLRAVERAKERAIADENFLFAKGLKMLTELLKQSGEELAKLEIAKKRAIQGEDFDTALSLKGDILTLRQALLTKMEQDGFSINNAGEVVVKQSPPKPKASGSTDPLSDSAHLTSTLSRTDLNYATTTNWDRNISTEEIRSNTPANLLGAVESALASTVNMPAERTTSTVKTESIAKSKGGSTGTSPKLSTSPKMKKSPKLENAEGTSLPPFAARKSGSVETAAEPTSEPEKTVDTKMTTSFSEVPAIDPVETMDAPQTEPTSTLPRKQNDPAHSSPAQNRKIVVAKDTPGTNSTASASPIARTSPSPPRPKPLVAADDRPINVKKTAIELDMFDENSVPPGMEPSRGNKKPAVIKKKSIAGNEEASSPIPKKNVTAPGSKSPTRKKKPAAIDTSPTTKKKPGIMSPGASPKSKRGPPVKPPVQSRYSQKATKVQEDEEAKSPTATRLHKRLESGHPFHQHPTSQYDVGDLTTSAKTEYFDAAFLFGEHIVACLMGKEFAAREWALGEVTRIVGEATMYATEHGDETDPNAVVRGVYAIITKGMADTREKVVSLTLQIWQNMIDYSNALNIPKPLLYRTIESLIPLLLGKVADPNPRLKAAALSFLVVLANAYSDFVLKSVFAPILLNAKPLIPPKMIKARMEAATNVTIESIPPVVDLEGMLLPFVLPLLGHSSVEIREGASRLVTAWYTRLHKDNGNYQVARRTILSQLASLKKPQLTETLKKTFDTISGQDQGGSGEVAEIPRTIKSPPVQKKGASKIKSPPVGRKQTSVGDLEDDDGGETGAADTTRSRLPVAQSSYVKEKNPPSPRKQSTSPAAEARSAVPKKQIAQKRALNKEAMANDWNIDKTCIFCNKTDENFTEDKLDIHYWQECPMLTCCPFCSQIVEISSLTNHYIHECEQKEDMKRCPKCRQAVSTNMFIEHKENCKGAPKGIQLCPLCKVVVPPGPTNWQDHLMRDKCPMNTRPSPRGRPSIISKKAPSPTKSPAAKKIQPAASKKGESSSPGRKASKAVVTAPAVKIEPVKKKSVFGFGGKK